MTHGLDTSFLVAAEVVEHPEHDGVWQRIRDLKAQGDRFALTALVVAELVHIVTDPRRFRAPLTMTQALAEAGRWWEASEVDQISADAGAVAWFFDAMASHQLGRKRVLDTMLAATYRGAGVASLLTLNASDFEVFGGFACLGPTIVRLP